MSKPSPASAGAQIQETVFYEGGPARGDLLLNLLFGLTLIGIPFAVGAIVRALWLRLVYSQIREVRSVPRGFGAWGDMVLVLNDGAKLEMRSVPRFRELEDFIEERRQTGQPAKPKGMAA
jgi:hypothetical protein